MSGVQRSLFFLGLPDLKELVCVTLSLQDDEDPRGKQIHICRELVLLFSDVLASPALDSFTHITVVVAIQFLQSGALRAFGHRRRLQLGSPQCVFPGDLQCCLSYSLITRLAPSWNKAGLYLVSGKGFLAERGRLNAVSMELSTSEGQLCFSIDPSSVRLPPTTLEDFNLPPLALRRFCSDRDSVLDPASSGGTTWCHVLPSMKKGQIITISRRLPRDGPFRTYADLQSHWNRLYGYRLPELAEEEVVYCSVYFRLVGERLFTYPLSCIRLQPPQCCPRADLQGALLSFLSDVRDRVQSVCGFPARLTRKPLTASLNSAASAQVLSDDEQLPAPPPPPRPVRPSRGSQPPAWTPLSQQVEAQGLLGNGGRFGSRLTQSQGCRGVRAWPSSSSSSSHVSISFPDPSDQQSAPSLSSSFSSSSFVRHFQSASSLTSSSVLPPPPPPPPTQTSMNAAPRLVPIFKNKQPSRHVNVALLRVQRTEEEEGRRRLTLPPSRKNRPTSSPLPLPDSSSSSSLASLPIPPPPIIPRFNCRRGPHSGATPTRPARPKIRRMSSLSPASKSGPGLLLLLAPNTEMKHGRAKSGSKTHVKLGTVSESVTDSGRKLQEKATEQPSAALPETPPPPPPPTSCDKDTTSTSGGAGVVFECKPKKSRVAVRDVDVEKMARSNQLFRVNSATLLVWLRGRGVSVSGKHKKDELMLKCERWFAALR
uniref:Si:ch211-152c8.2 n=1 Tax=Scophthalmus maximus TaxID=52904 RepID=A0A8D3D5H1_SCOMX